MWSTSQSILTMQGKLHLLFSSMACCWAGKYSACINVCYMLYRRSVANHNCGLHVVERLHSGISVQLITIYQIPFLRSVMNVCAQSLAHQLLCMSWWSRSGWSMWIAIFLLVQQLTKKTLWCSHVVSERLWRKTHFVFSVNGESKESHQIL